MTPHDTVQSRRTAILAAATDEMRRAQHRRVRNARIATAVLVASIGAMAALLLLPSAPRGLGQRTLAIDFASVGARPPAIDFAIIESPMTPVLDTLTDFEAEQALAESGYCVKILRVQSRPLLVDCATGRVTVIH